jgi:hypothetical protein
MPTIPLPLVNGVRHCYSSVELKIRSIPYVGIKSINYAWKISRAKVFGTHPTPIARTRGTLEVTGDVELYLEEYNAILTELGSGFTQVAFPIVVTYSETGLSTIVDTLLGVTLDEGGASQSQGNDALTRKLTLNILDIRLNGLNPIDLPLTGVST